MPNIKVETAALYAFLNSMSWRNCTNHLWQKWLLMPPSPKQKQAHPSCEEWGEAMAFTTGPESSSLVTCHRCCHSSWPRPPLLLWLSSTFIHTIEIYYSWCQHWLKWVSLDYCLVWHVISCHDDGLLLDVSNELSLRSDNQLWKCGQMYRRP